MSSKIISEFPVIIALFSFLLNLISSALIFKLLVSSIKKTFPEEITNDFFLSKIDFSLKIVKLLLDFTSTSPVAFIIYLNYQLRIDYIFF